MGRASYGSGAGDNSVTGVSEGERTMTTIARPGVPVGGFKAVGQIVGTNTMRVRRNQNALGVAVDLLTTHTPGAPVVDDAGQYVGFISEFDLLKALQSGKDLNQLTVELK